MAQAKIEVRGLDNTLRALSVIDPEATKAFRRGFKDAAEPITSKAKTLADKQPLTNWGKWSGRLDYEPAKAARGITTSVTASSRAARLRIVSKNPAAAVYENAGSRSNNQVTRALTAKRGKAPRLLVRTWKQEKGIKRMYVAVGRLIAAAERRVQAAMR